MEVIPFSGYTPFEKVQIGERHLLPKALEKTGVPNEKIEIPTETMEAIIS